MPMILTRRNSLSPILRTGDNSHFIRFYANTIDKFREYATVWKKHIVSPDHKRPAINAALISNQSQIKYIILYRF